MDCSYHCHSFCFHWTFSSIRSSHHCRENVLNVLKSLGNSPSQPCNRVAQIADSLCCPIKFHPLNTIDECLILVITIEFCRIIVVSVRNLLFMAENKSTHILPSKTPHVSALSQICNLQYHYYLNPCSGMAIIDIDALTWSIFWHSFQIFISFSHSRDSRLNHDVPMRCRHSVECIGML